MISDKERHELQRIREKRTETDKEEPRDRELFVLGIDLGTRHDSTAVVGLEKIRYTRFRDWIDEPTAPVSLNDPYSTKRPVYDSITEYHVRYIDRIALGISYADIVSYIIALNEAMHEYKPVIAIDVVGVGRAVLDMLREQGLTNVVPITTTASVEAGVKKNGEWSVGKAELAQTVKGLFGREIIKIAKDLDGAPQLLRELDGFAVKVSASTRRARYEAASEQIHDDLVSALAFASFLATKHKRIPIVAGEGVGEKKGMTLGRYESVNRTKLKEKWFSY
ncbi:MAG: hypothetical protein ACLPI9_00735 [Halobacteriota archaeon]